MSWTGGGTFNRVHNFSADASAGITAQASRFDAEFDEYKAGLENCQTLTGETTPTANAPMGGFRHTGVAAAVSADNYLRADQNANQVAIYVRDNNTTETGIISASAAIFPTSFTDGQRISVLVSASGSATSTRAIRVNGLSANIFDSDSSAVPGVNMKSGGVYDLVYDSSASGFKLATTAKLDASKVIVADTSSNYTAKTTEGIFSEIANVVDSTAGTFVAAFDGFSSDPPTPTVNWIKQGNIVNLRFGFAQGTSNSSAMAITNLPANLQPSTAQMIPLFGFHDNGADSATPGYVVVAGTSTVSFNFGAYNVTAGGFTTSGQKGLSNANLSISYTTSFTNT